ncbi:MAG: hypothetical protein JNM00_14160, partial [Flavobacteriales bacterium]|nr:hypothetical protein [Flavobacteriales bacterium]
TTDGLSSGTHYLYVRTQSEKGSWSHPSRVEMLISDSEITVGCPGDFDRNGSINTSDLLLFLGNFATTGDCSFDLTGDFTVNTSDLLLFLSTYGSDCN